MNLLKQIELFKGAKEDNRRSASQIATLFLLCGIELDQALAETGPRRARTIVRIERLLERERLRGQRRHWSYDLNRHIALKQALDRLRGRDPEAISYG